jgi:hypothetical protein
MIADDLNLKGVVVTALGIKREKKALIYTQLVVKKSDVKSSNP